MSNEHEEKAGFVGACCPRCQHFGSCEKPCPAVDMLVGPEPYEVHDGKRIVIHPDPREVHISHLESLDADGDGNKIIEQYLNTLADSPFRQFDPRLKITGIFVDRFFYKWSYADIAVKYETTERTATALYSHAVNRVFEVLEALDREKALVNFKGKAKQMEERSGSLAKGVKWFLMNKVFGLSPPEIAKLDEVRNQGMVNREIALTYDKLIAGEFNLFEVAPEPFEIEAARNRLDAKRRKKRAWTETNKARLNAERRKAQGFNISRYR